MSLKIIITNSRQNISLLNALLRGLADHGASLTVISADQETRQICQKNNWPTPRPLPAPNIQSVSGAALFILLYPILFLVSLTRLALNQRKQKINVIICLDWLDRLLYTPLAKLLRCRVVWLVLPNKNIDSCSWLARPLLRLTSRWAKVAVFNNATQKQLEHFRWPAERIHLINYGINASQYQHQENIFSRLANTSTNQQNQKFFSIGTAVNLKQPHNLETMFKAVKKTLNVIPNLQLIIIGSGEELKNLKWLSQKMNIDAVVWFVGEQIYLKKWLDNLAIYIAGCQDAVLADINAVLHAAAAGLPIIAPRGLGLDDMVIENVNGLLLDADDSEAMAQAIIKLRQDNRLRRKMGQHGQALVESKHAIKNCTEELWQLFKE